jgi:hypothetical protein
VTDVVVFRIPFPEMNASVRQHLNQRIHEVVVSDCKHVECLRKQSYLFVSLHQGNEDDQASMNIELCVFLQKVATIVGNDDVVVGDRVWALRESNLMENLAMRIIVLKCPST